MFKIRAFLIALACLLFFGNANAMADVRIGFGTPNLYLGINLNTLPGLVPIPGYPVYYAPQLGYNYFFYDGLYWVYLDSNWYASSWYDGPWSLVSPYDVPVFILRIPIRYFNNPPPLFRGWVRERPPHWATIWGRNWETRRQGWDRWDRRVVPPRAPIPLYQNQYPKDRYPGMPTQRRELEQQHYRYQPRDPRIRQYFNQQQYQRPPQRRQMREQPRQGEIRQGPGAQPRQQGNGRDQRRRNDQGDDYRR